MAKCNYHLSPCPLPWAIDLLLEICKPVEMWDNLAREVHALLRKYLVKTRGLTQPKFGIAGFSHIEVCSDLHLERTQDSLSPYQYLQHFPRVFLDSEAVIDKTEVQRSTSE